MSRKTSQRYSLKSKSHTLRNSNRKSSVGSRWLNSDSDISDDSKDNSLWWKNLSGSPIRQSVFGRSLYMSRILNSDSDHITGELCDEWWKTLDSTPKNSLQNRLKLKQIPTGITDEMESSTSESENNRVEKKKKSVFGGPSNQSNSANPFINAFNENQVDQSSHAEQVTSGGKLNITDSSESTVSDKVQGKSNKTSVSQQSRPAKVFKIKSKFLQRNNIRRSENPFDKVLQSTLGTNASVRNSSKLESIRHNTDQSSESSDSDDSLPLRKRETNKFATYRLLRNSKKIENTMIKENEHEANGSNQPVVSDILKLRGNETESNDSSDSDNLMATRKSIDHKLLKSPNSNVQTATNHSRVSRDSSDDSDDTRSIKKSMKRTASQEVTKNIDENLSSSDNSIPMKKQRNSKSNTPQSLTVSSNARNSQNNSNSNSLKSNNKSNDRLSHRKNLQNPNSTKMTNENKDTSDSDNSAPVNKEFSTPDFPRNVSNSQGALQTIVDRNSNGEESFSNSDDAHEVDLDLQQQTNKSQSLEITNKNIHTSTHTRNEEESSDSDDSLPMKRRRNSNFNNSQMVTRQILPTDENANGESGITRFHASLNPIDAQVGNNLEKNKKRTKSSPTKTRRRDSSDSDDSLPRKRLRNSKSIDSSSFDSSENVEDAPSILNNQDEQDTGDASNRSLNFQNSMGFRTNENSKLQKSLPSITIGKSLNKSTTRSTSILHPIRRTMDNVESNVDKNLDEIHPAGDSLAIDAIASLRISSDEILVNNKKLPLLNKSSNIQTIHNSLSKSPEIPTRETSTQIRINEDSGESSEEIDVRIPSPIPNESLANRSRSLVHERLMAFKKQRAEKLKNMKFMKLPFFTNHNSSRKPTSTDRPSKPPQTVMTPVKNFEKPPSSSTTEKQRVMEFEKFLKEDAPPKPVKKRNIQQITINGKVYKPPRLARPKPWVTNRLYSRIQKSMKPRYHIETKVRSERFIKKLAIMVDLITKEKYYDDYSESLEALMKEMARLNILTNRYEFYTFCHEFLPYSFRIKVIPMLLPGNVYNIPYDESTLFTPLLDSSR